MPITKVEAPDGSIIKVDHPEGASQEDILAFAQSEYANRSFASSLGKADDAAAKIKDPQGGSIADPLGQGLSFGFSDEIAGGLGAGFNSIANIFGKGTGESFVDAYRGIRDAARQNAGAFEARNPGTSLLAEISGGMLTGGVGAARAGVFNAARSAPTLAGRLSPIVQAGAVQGGAYGLGTSEAETLGGMAADTAQGAAIGAATAPIIPALAGGTRAVANRALQVKDTPIYQSAVRLLEQKAGLNLTSGQKTGSDALKSTETTIADTFFGGAINRALDTNRKKLQSELFRMAGFTDDDVASGVLTREALDNARERFSQRYARLFAGTSVDLNTQEFREAIAKIASKHSDFITPLQKRQINAIIKEFIDKAGKPMTGRVYQKHRSSLGQKAARNGEHSDLYRDLKGALDEAFFASGGSRMGRKLLDLQYGRYKQLLDVYQKSGSQQISEGLVPLSMIMRSAARQPDREFERIVRAGQMVLGDPVANSGTPTRAINALALMGGGAAAGGLDAGLLAIGLPIGLSQTLSRGITGSGVVDRLIQGGLLTAPVTAPIGTRILNPAQ